MQVQLMFTTSELPANRSLFKSKAWGASQVVQWLEGMDSTPGQGTKILHAAQCGQRKKC